MQLLFIFSQQQNWFQSLIYLSHALEEAKQSEALEAYSELFRDLSEAPYTNLSHAFAETLLYEHSSLSQAVQRGTIPNGLKEAALFDLENMLEHVARDWRTETSSLVGKSLPALDQLANAALEPELAALTTQLTMLSANELWELLLNQYKTQGTGELARYKAFKYASGDLVGIQHPVRVNLEQLFDLEKQLASLQANTEAFLKGFKAQHSLLYGPRGSGKSTAIRALLSRFETQGLRLIELPAHDLEALHDLVEQLRGRPHFYIIFVDDLSFEAGDNSYQPLKTILEGSLNSQPNNVLIYATSNRRHLVKEQFSDRPDPLNDDVHGWDTQHERLALSDRFGLTITFPSPSQKRYLGIVMNLAEQATLEQEDLKQRAIRFAEWGNGYSGRTAQQFIDSLKAGLA